MGRDPGCGIVIQGKDVSRRHASLAKSGGEFILKDLGSSSGTWVEGRRLNGPWVLRSGTTVYLGSVAVTFDFESHEQTILLGGPRGDAGERITVRADASRRGPLPVEGLEDRMAVRLAMLYDLPLQFASTHDLASLCNLVLRRLIELIPGAERGAILVNESATGKLAVRASVPEEDPPISRTLVIRAATERQGFIWEEESEQDLALSMIRHSIRTGMYVPLLWKETALGVLCLDNPAQKKAFREEDLQLMIFVAHYAASAVANQSLQDDIEQNNRTLQNLLGNFSPKLRNKLLQKSREGKLQPGGEKSEVSILLSDLRGFTRASALMDAEAVVNMLNDYFSILGDIIFQHDGTIDKFIGDAILAVFGSPEHEPDHALKASRCALAMQEAMTLINSRRRQGGLPVCDAGIGIYTGEVLHGFIGAAERMEFTVIGDTVNKASRYCDGAKAGEVLLGPSTWEIVSPAATADSCMIATKHEGELQAWRLTGCSGI